MNTSSITLFNLVLHSLTLGLLGWLVVRWCIRDARRRAHAALMVILLVLIAPWVVAQWPYPYHAPQAPVLNKIHQALQTEWRIKVDAPPATEPIIHASSKKPVARSWSFNDLANGLRITWLAGFVFMLTRHLWQSCGTWRWRTRLRPPTGEEWRAVRKSVNRHAIRVFDHEGSPCVVGLFDPVIAVPASAFQRLDAQEWRWLLRHEGEHLRGGDVALTWLLGWTRAIGWWNPFLHALIECSTRSREEVCDAVALGRVGAPEDYAEFLLEVAAGKQSLVAGAVPMVQSRPARRLRARLAALLSARPVCARLGWAYLMVSSVSYILGYTLIASVGMTASAQDKNAPLIPVQQTAPSAVPKPPGPNAPSDALLTWSFHVPPDFLANRKTATETLTLRGIPFPEGASAIYNAATSQLIVKNTAVNLAEVEKLVADASAIVPQLYVTSRVIEAAQTFGVSGQVLEKAELTKLLSTIEGHAGAHLLTAPSVTMRVGQRAMVEQLRESVDKDEKQFAGIRIEIDAQPEGKGRILARVVPTFGLEDGQPLKLGGSGPSNGDWSKIHMFGTEAQQHFASGETLVLHLPLAGRSFTMLVTMQAMLPSGYAAPNFEKIKALPSTGVHAPGDFEALAKEAAKRNAEWERRRIYVTAKVVDLPRGAEKDLGFGWLLEDVQAPHEVVAGDKEQAAKVNPPVGIYSIAGVFTDPQYQVVIRALNQKKGADLTSLPSVTAKTDQELTFTVPKEQGGGQLKVTPVLGPDGYTIDLAIAVDGTGEKRWVTTAVTIWDGQTVCMGGVFKVDEKEQRPRMVFITAKMIDPKPEEKKEK